MNIELSCEQIARVYQVTRDEIRALAKTVPNTRDILFKRLRGFNQALVKMVKALKMEGYKVTGL